MHRLHRVHQCRIYEFDGTSGVLQKILDEHGNSLTCAYTGNLLSGVSDGHGRTLSFAYDVNGKLSSTGDGTRTVSYVYTGMNLTSFTDAAGHTTMYSYAAGPYPGLLTSATTPLGTTPLTYAYDADGRVSSETDALSNTWSFSVGPGGGCIMSMPTGDMWTAIHNTAFRLISLQDPLGGMTSWTYDASGRPASVTRPLGDVTTLTYDAASGFPSDLGLADGTLVRLNPAPLVVLVDGVDLFRVAGISYPDGTSESFTYGASGNLITRVDPSGQPWVITSYNANGQPLSMTNPAGGMTSFTYDSRLRLASRTDNAGNTTTFAYDGLDRLVTLTHPNLTTRTYTYDGTNYLVAWSDEAGQVWNQPVDANGRVTSRTDPLGHTVQYTYDAMDRVTGVTDALGHTATYAYDALGRLTSATDRTGRTMTYAYDALSRLVTRTDPGSNATTFTYDANGRLLTATDPLAHAMTYQYDALDRLTRATDPLGNAVQYSYDSMGRLTSANAPLGHTQTYGYDPRGLLTSFFDVTAEAQFPRTSLGEVGSIRDPGIKVWPFGHDAQGRQTSSADPLGRATSLTYDNRNRVSHVVTPVGTVDPTYDPVGDGLQGQWVDASGTVTLSYVHDAARRLTAATGATVGYDAADRITSSNGITFTHDNAGRLTSETYAPSKTVTYSYNTRGLLAQVSDWLGGTTSFAYDAAGRLTGMTPPDGTTAAYAYDAADRLISSVEQKPPPGNGPLASISLTRDALGQITSAVRNVPLKPAVTAPTTTGYAYDDAGQIVGMSFDGLGRLTGDGTRTFQYDAAGRLTHYVAGTESPTFTYDAFGRMLTRTDGAVTQQFVWADITEPTQPLLDKITQGGATISYFVHTPGGVPLYRVDASGDRTFYHYDEAGNAIFLTNEGGSVVTSYAYTPTGKTEALGYTAENPYTYAAAAGAIQLGSSGLWAAGPRHYDEVTARCISCPAAPLATSKGCQPLVTDVVKNQNNWMTSRAVVPIGGLASVDGVMVGGVHRVDGIESETDIVEYKDGEDGTMHLRPGRSKPARITIEKDWSSTKEFFNWRQSVLGGGRPFNGPVHASVVGCWVDDLTDKGASSVFNVSRHDPYKNFSQPGPLQSTFFVLPDDMLNQVFASLSVQPGPQQSPMAFIHLPDDLLNQMLASLYVSPGPINLPAVAFCSNIPYLDVTKPDGVVVSARIQPGALLQQQGRVITDFQQGRVSLDATFNTLYEVGDVLQLNRQGACHGWKGDDCN